MEIFKLRLMSKRDKARLAREAKRINSTRPCSQLELDSASPNEEPEESKEEVIESEDDILQKTDRELGLEPDDKNFCYAYYKSEYKQLRQEIIKEVFRDLTGKWNRHFVVYPLSPCDDIQLML